MTRMVPGDLVEITVSTLSSGINLLRDGTWDFAGRAFNVDQYSVGIVISFLDVNWKSEIPSGDEDNVVYCLFPRAIGWSRKRWIEALP